MGWDRLYFVYPGLALVMCACTPAQPSTQGPRPASETPVTEEDRDLVDTAAFTEWPDPFKPRPARDEAFRTYQEWHGQCDMADAQTRERIELGAKLLWPDALQCLFSHHLAGRDWPELSRTERKDLLPMLVSLSVLTEAPEFLAMDVCDFSMEERLEISQIAFGQFQRAAVRPPAMRPPVPFNYASPIHDRLECRP
jgi:hypothetical protein